MRARCFFNLTVLFFIMRPAVKNPKHTSARAVRIRDTPFAVGKNYHSAVTGFMLVKKIHHRLKISSAAAGKIVQRQFLFKRNRLRVFYIHVKKNQFHFFNNSEKEKIFYRADKMGKMFVRDRAGNINRNQNVSLPIIARTEFLRE